MADYNEIESKFLKDTSQVKILQELERRFPNSNRCKYINAHLLIHNKQSDQATQILQEILSNDPNNKRALKLLISLLPAETSIKLLVNYLNVFICDEEMWKELAELYRVQEQWQQSIYCLEQCVLLDCSKVDIYKQLAEVKKVNEMYGNIRGSKEAERYWEYVLHLEGESIDGLEGLIGAIRAQKRGDKKKLALFEKRLMELSESKKNA